MYLYVYILDFNLSIAYGNPEIVHVFVGPKSLLD